MTICKFGKARTAALACAAAMMLGAAAVAGAHETAPGAGLDGFDPTTLFAERGAMEEGTQLAQGTVQTEGTVQTQPLEAPRAPGGGGISAGTAEPAPGGKDQPAPQAPVAEAPKPAAPQASAPQAGAQPGAQAGAKPEKAPKVEVVHDDHVTIVHWYPCNCPIYRSDILDDFRNIDQKLAAVRGGLTDSPFYPRPVHPRPVRRHPKPAPRRYRWERDDYPVPHGPGLHFHGSYGHTHSGYHEHRGYHEHYDRHGRRYGHRHGRYGYHRHPDHRVHRAQREYDRLHRSLDRGGLWGGSEVHVR
ncbi:MAG: hypothetical protein AAF074_04755 [Pseudomonadota bacterium]